MEGNIIMVVLKRERKLCRLNAFLGLLWLPGSLNYALNPSDKIKPDPSIIYCVKLG
jgi:hypothetical protein